MGSFILINFYIQFFDIESYTPHKTFYQLESFNYHQFTKRIKDALPDKPLTLFLASIPDAYLDLKNNTKYKLYQAIDPNYPISESEYKKALDQSDYIIYTWLPHDLLASYVYSFGLNNINIQAGGYNVTIAELKPKNQRN